jgi:CubicO group peptidase (beta-lactamase class C family)
MSSTIPAADPVAAIDHLLEPLNRSDAPGLVIGVNRDGHPLVRRGLGLASLEHGVANTPRTRMRIASTSKHFTALAILLLAEEGRLGLDDGVRRHLPELPALAAGEPTVRQLLNHTSGWRGHDELWVLAQGLALQPPGVALAAMARQGELNAEPGTRLIYSNGGYHLLALIIARLGGVGYAEFLRARIFEPLGMVDTESVASDLDVRPGLATLYVPELGASGPTGGWRRGLYPCALEGSGSIVSTLDDMLLWLAHLRGAVKTVGSDATWAQMLAPTMLRSGERVPYGFGLAHHAHRGVDVIHHNGAVFGGSSQMITVPAHDLDIMIIANGAAVSPSQLAFRIIELLLGEQLSEPPEPRAAAGAHPGLIGQRYHAPGSGTLVGFAQVGDRLALSWLGGSPIPLRERAGGVWLGFLDLAQNAVDIDLEGLDTTQAPATLTLREGGELRRLQRLPDTPPVPATLASQLCGAYRCPDLDASARIDLRGETLLLVVQGRHGQMTARLTPLSDAVLTVAPTDPLLAALGASSTLNVERSVDGHVTGLRFDGARTRRLRFLCEEQAA